MTFSEGYYTNQTVLRDICHTQYITDACKPETLQLEKCQFFFFF